VAKKKLKFKELPTGKPHISFSEMSDWIDCSWRHRRKQIDKIDLSTFGVALDNGTGIHASCEDFLKTRKMNTQIAVDFITEAFEKQVKEGPKSFYEYVRFKDTPEEFQKLKKRYVKNGGKATKPIDIVYDVFLEEYTNGAVEVLNELPAFMDENFPDWEPVEAEHYLYEPTHDNSEHAFKGFIDCVIKCTGKRGKPVYWIIDWKTSGRGWFRDKRQDPKTKKQLILYKHYYCTKKEIPPKDVRCGFVILKRQAKKDDHVELFPVSVGDVTTERSLKVINDMFASMNRKMFLKNKTKCKWCDYKGTKHCTGSDNPSLY
jgi:hypothetical protein